MTTTDWQPVVAATAEALDEAEPGWAEKIDKNILDMGNRWCCIGGQLWGNFFKEDVDLLFAPPIDNCLSASQVGARLRWAQQHGLGADLEGKTADQIAAIHEAQRICWLAEIDQRLAA